MRPSKNTDEQLVKAAMELIQEHSSIEIGLREVAERAKVNMGMFYYHFKDRDDFFSRVLQEYYEEFFESINLEAEKELNETTVQKLKRVVMFISEFAVKNKQIVSAIFIGAVNGDQVARKFLRKNLIRHVRILVDLIKEAQKKGDMTNDLPPFSIFIMMMAGVNGPTFAFMALSKGTFNTAKLRLVGANKETVISKDAIEKRLNVLLDALTIKVKK